MTVNIDPLFQVNAVMSTPNPQSVVWVMMHQDNCTDYIWDGSFEIVSERISGERIVKHLLLGDRGHYGCFEHPQINLLCGYFPHAVMQQLRTHRVGISFDVQSFRLSSESIIGVAEGAKNIEKVFYLRPVGTYTDRAGKSYEYTAEERSEDLAYLLTAAQRYSQKIAAGMPAEQARSLLPFDYRQHFGLSLNARSLMHLLDLRWKKDCQIETQWFAELLFKQFEKWMPEVAAWYEKNRAKKARLAP